MTGLLLSHDRQSRAHERQAFAKVSQCIVVGRLAGRRCVWQPFVRRSKGVQGALKLELMGALESTFVLQHMQQVMSLLLRRYPGIRRRRGCKDKAGGLCSIQTRLHRQDNQTCGQISTVRCRMFAQPSQCDFAHASGANAALQGAQKCGQCVCPRSALQPHCRCRLLHLCAFASLTVLLSIKSGYVAAWTMCVCARVLRMWPACHMCSAAAQTYKPTNDTGGRAKRFTLTQTRRAEAAPAALVVHYLRAALAAALHCAHSHSRPTPAPKEDRL